MNRRLPEKMKKRVAFTDCVIIFEPPCNQVNQNVLHWLQSRSFYISGLQVSCRPIFLSRSENPGQPEPALGGSFGVGRAQMGLDRSFGYIEAVSHLLVV